MKTNEQNMDAKFRQKLSGYESKPTPGAWQKLSSRLEEDNQKDSSNWKYAVAASLLLAMTLSVIGYQSTRTKSSSTLSQNITEQPSDPINSTINDQEITARPLDQQKLIKEEDINDESEVNDKPLHLPLGENIARVEINEAKPTLSKQKETPEDHYLISRVSRKSFNLEPEYAELELELDELAVLTYQDTDEQKLKARYKLRNAWQNIKRIKNGEDEFSGISKAKNEFIAFASKGIQNGIQKLKTNRNDDETDD